MKATDIALFVQFWFLTYFVVISLVYLMLAVLSAVRFWREMQEQEAELAPRPYSGLEPAVSVLVPAHNEERTIVASLHSLLNLEYPEYEVIVINDGSEDQTLQAMIEQFRLVPFPESAPQKLRTETVHAIYQSTLHPNLRVIDKANGGKADSLNAGLNIARSPLFCSIDADSILQKDSLQILVRPFLNDARTVAAGGTIRIANGCVVRDGMLVNADLPKKPLAMLQIVEYLRAFLFGRIGWAPMNGLLVISGAMGLFDRKIVVRAGGYRTDTVGEDMELVVRLHRLLSEEGVDYRIAFMPDPVCYTEAPEDLKSLRLQRTRWQRGLCESLGFNMHLLFHRNGGAAGWLAFPFMLIFEMLGPIIELLGYLFVIVLWILGLINVSALLLFFAFAIALGTLLSLVALMLEEMSFHIYTRPGQLLKLILYAIFDNLGYRQLNAVWRLIGVFQWATGKRGGWGKAARSGSWNKTFKPIGAGLKHRKPAH